MSRRSFFSRLFGRKRAAAADAGGGKRRRRRAKQEPLPAGDAPLHAEAAPPPLAPPDAPAPPDDSAGEPWYRHSGPIFEESFTDRRTSGPPRADLGVDGGETDGPEAGARSGAAAHAGPQETDSTGPPQAGAAPDASSDDAARGRSPSGESVPPLVPIIQRIEPDGPHETPAPADEAPAEPPAEPDPPHADEAPAETQTEPDPPHADERPDAEAETGAEDAETPREAGDEADSSDEEAADEARTNVEAAADAGSGADGSDPADVDESPATAPSAQVEPTQSAAPQTAGDLPTIVPIRGYYVARTHDTLRSVAAQFLNAPERWSELRTLNAAYPGIADIDADALLPEGTALALPGDPLVWGRPDPVHLWTLAETFLFTAWGREPTPEEVVPFWRGLSSGTLPAGADPSALGTDQPALGTELPGIAARVPQPPPGSEPAMAPPPPFAMPAAAPEADAPAAPEPAEEPVDEVAADADAIDEGEEDAVDEATIVEEVIDEQAAVENEVIVDEDIDEEDTIVDEDIDEEDTIVDEDIDEEDTIVDEDIDEEDTIVDEDIDEEDTIVDEDADEQAAIDTAAVDDVADDATADGEDAVDDEDALDDHDTVDAAAVDGDVGFADIEAPTDPGPAEADTEAAAAADPGHAAPAADPAQAETEPRADLRIADFEAVDTVDTVETFHEPDHEPDTVETFHEPETVETFHEPETLDADAAFEFDDVEHEEANADARDLDDDAIDDDHFDNGPIFEHDAQPAVETPAPPHAAPEGIAASYASPESIAPPPTFDDWEAADSHSLDPNAPYAGLSSFEQFEQAQQHSELEAPRAPQFLPSVMGTSPVVETSAQRVKPVGRSVAGTAIGDAMMLWQLARRRRQGNRAAPSGDGIEQSLQETANSESLMLIAAAMRHLWAVTAGQGQPSPDVLAVRVGTYGFEVLLARPAAAPPGWRSASSGHVLELPPGVTARDLGAVGPGPSLCPALVPVGNTFEGPLLLNLQQIGTLAVSGPSDAASRLVAAVATTLASSPMAEDIQIAAVGLHHYASLPGWERVRLVPFDSPELDATLAASASDADRPTIVFFGPGHDLLIQRAAQMLADRGHNGSLVGATSAAGTRWPWSIHVDGTATAVVHPVGITMTAAQAPSSEYLAQIGGASSGGLDPSALR